MKHILQYTHDSMDNIKKVSQTYSQCLKFI